jgi:CRP-like cAMP-binding protein
MQTLVFKQNFAKGKFLVTKGEVCKRTFFVERGLLRFYDISDEGKEQIIQFAPEGWFLNTRDSICFDMPSSYFIDALEDTKVAVLEQSFLDYALKLSEHFRLFNRNFLQRNIHQLENRVKLLIGMKAEERYIDFVTIYPNLVQRVPLWMIASYLGITPESLSRIRRNIDWNKNILFNEQK